MSSVQKFGSSGKGYNPFTAQYLSQARAIGQQQGFTAGEKEGFGADDSQQFAPPIFSVPPNEVKTLGRQEVYGSTDFMDRPFYEGEIIPPTGGVEFVSGNTDAPNQAKFVEKAQNNILPIVLIMGLLFLIFGRR